MSRLTASELRGDVLDYLDEACEEVVLAVTESACDQGVALAGMKALVALHAAKRRLERELEAIEPEATS